jgi:hypothetical protein
MSTRYFFSVFFAVLFLLGSQGICAAQDPPANLTVKEISFKADKGGKEQVSVLCSQACVPALSGLEGKNPRIVMDFAGVSFMDAKYRNLPVPGRQVKKIRSYLDSETKKLRVVLDMAPSKHFVVRTTQDQASTAFSLEISEKRQARGKAGKAGISRIAIVDRTPKPLEKVPEKEKAAEKKEPVRVARPSVDEKTQPAADRSAAELGRSQMNTGDYKGAIQTFTRNVADNPRDSLSYRLRGNAYQNIGEREKAIEDWKTAARLGDPIIQSYLDHMQINWKEAPGK